MTLTVSTSTISLLTPAEFLKRCDANMVGQLCADSSTTGAATPVSAAGLLTDLKLQAALDDAMALLESAVRCQDRYSIDDLAALITDGGVGCKLIYRILTPITFSFLLERRPLPGVAPMASFGWAMEQLQLLRAGERIFSFTETATAGRPEHQIERPSDVERRNGIVVQADRYFGQRSNRTSEQFGA